MLASAATTAAFAHLMQPVFDDVLINQKEDRILWVASAIFGCLVLRGLSTYGQVVFMNKIGQDIVATLQSQLFAKLMAAPVLFHQKNPSGSLITRMISDTQMMRSAVADSITGIGKSLLTLLFLLGVMIYQDWKLSLYALAIFPFATVFLWIVGKKIRKVSRKTQEHVSGFSDKLSQSLQGVRQVKIYNKQAHESGRMRSLIERVRDFNIKSVQIGNLTTPVNDLLVGGALFALISYGGFGVIEGDLTPGSLVSFITAFLLAYEPMKRLSKLNSAYNIGLGAADRVFEILDGEEEQGGTAPDVSCIVTDDEKAKQVSLRFDNVSFRYEDQDVSALNHISFTLNPGETIALVGSSGGGKSTILNLVPRFFEPNDGVITLNEKPLNTFSLAQLREKIAYVSQDIMIFDESVAYNIAYGGNASTEEIDMHGVKEAAKTAFAHEFINALPEGYNTRLGEMGTRLSGGQKQRIALARAIYKNAPLLLLDEATSALDTESETYIQQSLQTLQKDRSCLVVAHRLSTIQGADRILVIDKGSIVEEGTHESLLEKRGVYYMLYEQDFSA
tara:strand:- start:417 stop:2099 length:1683 start_codon:yes stop_codon:yes gene_type:complete